MALRRIYVRLMRTVFIDLICGFHSASGYNYVLVVVESYSGFVWLRPLMEKMVIGVSDRLIEIFFSFGFPQRICSDNGTEFVNQDLEMITKATCIVTTTGQSHNPKAQSIVERRNQNMGETLRKFV